MRLDLLLLDFASSNLQVLSRPPPLLFIFLNYTCWIDYDCPKSRFLSLSGHAEWAVGAGRADQVPRDSRTGGANQRFAFIRLFMHFELVIHVVTWTKSGFFSLRVGRRFHLVSRCRHAWRRRRCDCSGYGRHFFEKKLLVTAGFGVCNCLLFVLLIMSWFLGLWCAFSVCFCWFWCSNCFLLFVRAKVCRWCLLLLAWCLKCLHLVVWFIAFVYFIFNVCIDFFFWLISPMASFVIQVQSQILIYLFIYLFCVLKKKKMEIRAFRSPSCSWAKKSDCLPWKTTSPSVLSVPEISPRLLNFGAARNFVLGKKKKRSDCLLNQVRAPQLLLGFFFKKYLFTKKQSHLALNRMTGF